MIFFCHPTELSSVGESQREWGMVGDRGEERELLLFPVFAYKIFFAGCAGTLRSLYLPRFRFYSPSQASRAISKLLLVYEVLSSR
jgi:hypothetical protein